MIIFNLELLDTQCFPYIQYAAAELTFFFHKNQHRIGLFNYYIDFSYDI